MTTMTTVSAPLHCQGVPRIADLFHSAGSGKNKNTYLKQSILFLFLFFYYTFFVWFFFLLTKSRKTIRRGIDFSNEPTGNAKFMSPPASGQSMIWCKDKKADFSLVFLFFSFFILGLDLFCFVFGGKNLGYYWASWPTCSFLGRSGYFLWEKLKHQICSLEH